MTYDFITILKLIVATLIPTIVSVILLFIERKTKFQKLNYFIKQAIIGLIFGLITISIIELRVDASIVYLDIACIVPLICGLTFGGESGIVACLIGGLYQYLSKFWFQEDFIFLANILAIIISGLIGFIAKRFIFNNKKTPWVFGLILGIFVQVIHLLLVFLTKMDSIKASYSVVSSIVIPLMICSSISSSLAIFTVNFIDTRNTKEKNQKKHISEIFQIMLAIVIVGCFSLTSYFTYYFQTKVTESDYAELLNLNMYDLKIDVISYSDDSMLKEVKTIAKNVSSTSSSEELVSFSSQFDVYELDIVSNDGIIQNSNLSEKKNYDLNSNSIFNPLLEYVVNNSTYVMDLDFDSNMKYIAVKLDSGFVLAGYSLSQYQNVIDEQYILAVSNRHIGESGDILVYDEDLNNLWDKIVLGGVETPKESIEKLNDTQEKILILPIHGEESFCISFKIQNLLFVIYYPASDALVNRNIAFILMAFMEIIAYCTLFSVIYLLLDKSIVKNVHKINKSLKKITAGQLDSQVDVRGNYEFNSLSNDINCTVNTLKKYIEQEKNRNEQEVRFAREIQESSLPNIFPAFPNRNDFDIYATMEAAKEVGGDFYDFYLLDRNHLVFLIADVSGKGIPAAMFMMKAKAIIKNQVESGKSIDEAFNSANLYLLEGNKARMFVTAWIGNLDLRNGHLEYVNAGHNPPLIIRNNKSVEFIQDKPNFVLAGSKKSKYVKHELDLDIKDSIFLYTDGVTEAMDDKENLYSPNRLKNILSNVDKEFTPKELCEYVKQDMDVFVNGAMQSDDITMLSIRLDHFENKNSITAYPDMDSYPKVVNFVDTKLQSLNVEKTIKSKALIALDEIYSNIIKYANANKSITKVFVEDDFAIMEFNYDGIKFDFHDAESPDTTLPLKERKKGGLGLYIVRKTASEVTYTYENELNILKVKYKLTI